MGIVHGCVDMLDLLNVEHYTYTNIRIMITQTNRKSKQITCIILYMYI